MGVRAKTTVLMTLEKHFLDFELPLDIDQKSYMNIVGKNAVSAVAIKRSFKAWKYAMVALRNRMRVVNKEIKLINTSGIRPAENTKADQRAQAATNPHGFSDAQQKAFDDMVSSGRWNEDGTVNMEWWESLSSKEQKTAWYEGTTGGFGLGDNDMHRKMKTSLDEIYRSTRPKSEGMSGLTFGGGSGSTERKTLSGLEALRANLEVKDE